MKRPLLWGIIVANLMCLIALAFVYPHAMLSPGALVPAHAALADKCFACHAPFRGAVSDRCVVCHAVADIGVRTTTRGPVAKGARPAIRARFHQQLRERNCVACHTDHGRLTERRFSHDLLPAAARADCAACHTAPSNDMHRDRGVSWNLCHTSERWSSATFNHAVLPSAKLARCESCHAAPTDSFHRQIALACAQCHQPGQWKPSTFNHDRFFLLDRHHNTTCATCHVNGDFKRYTCFGCHEHTPENIRAEHEEEGIRNLDNCASCHRSADGERGERGGHGKGKEDDEH